VCVCVCVCVLLLSFREIVNWLGCFDVVGAMRGRGGRGGLVEERLAKAPPGGSELAGVSGKE